MVNSLGFLRQRLLYIHHPLIYEKFKVHLSCLLKFIPVVNSSENHILVLVVWINAKHSKSIILISILADNHPFLFHVFA